MMHVQPYVLIVVLGLSGIKLLTDISNENDTKSKYAVAPSHV